MLRNNSKSLGNHVFSLEKKKKSYSGKDLQKRKVLSWCSRPLKTRSYATWRAQSITWSVAINNLRDRTVTFSFVKLTDWLAFIKTWQNARSTIYNRPNIIIQAAQLSPSDRAMRLVSSNLANYHATVQKLLIRQVLNKPMVWSWRFSWRQCVINACT